jgi:kinesin family member 11
MAGPTRASTLKVPKRSHPTGAGTRASTPASNTIKPTSIPSFIQQNDSIVTETPSNYPKRSPSAMSNAPPSKRRQTEFEEEQSMVIDSKGTNIQVVVRCRGRSDREVKENSPVVVTATGGLRGKEITVSNGLVPPMSNKTYTFDRVFGPEADQAMIYDDVVAPFLEEVLPYGKYADIGSCWV